jgi:hypothetical protein
MKPFLPPEILILIFEYCLENRSLKQMLWLRLISSKSLRRIILTIDLYATEALCPSQRLTILSS